MSNHTINELNDIEMSDISAGRFVPKTSVNVSPVIYGPRLNMNVGVLVVAGNRGVTSATLKQILFA